MSAETLERSVLEGKDREQLLAIAQALGVKGVSRAKKGDLIDRILEQTGGAPNGAPDDAVVARPVDEPDGADAAQANGPAPSDNGAAASTAGDRGDDVPPDTRQRVRDDRPDTIPSASSAAAAAGSTDAASAPTAPAEGGEVLVGDDGEPLAEWEIELRRQGVSTEVTVGEPNGAADGIRRSRPNSATSTRDDADADGDDGADDGSGKRRRRRRRRRGGGADEGPQGQDRYADERGPEPSQEPVKVAGYLDLRDEGYGFLRVNGYLSSKEDAYVSVKQSRQYGLRKGDYVTGISRAASRNEKSNPALLEVHTVNGQDPEKARNRPRFEDLTPLFPDERLRLENGSDPLNMTARIIDLVAPIGKGQRGIIVSPPKAGKTFVMKTIATSIERNNPEVKLIVLLIDERPEEVTDFRRTVQGEVIASTFDRPSDEHTHMAELVIERAKRMVEQGDDVVIILDGITRLSRAYNLAAPATGRIMSGGIDAGALYPPKKFFGAARNIEEGGSLTILATALVETNSRMDDAIFEEFKGTGNMELRLDRKLAERRIYPAIDVDASSTRHEELLFDRKQLQMVWKLRRVLSGLAADGNAAPGLELLIDRLKTFRTNDEFLSEIAKQPSM
jgi:transcription termination factor Rho